MCLTGSANGVIYIWVSAIVRKVLQFSSSFISTLRFSEGKFYCGRKDGIIAVIDQDDLDNASSLNL